MYEHRAATAGNIDRLRGCPILSCILVLVAGISMYKPTGSTVAAGGFFVLDFSLSAITQRALCVPQSSSHATRSQQVVSQSLTVSTKPYKLLVNSRAAVLRGGDVVKPPLCNLSSLDGYRFSRLILLHFLRLESSKLHSRFWEANTRISSHITYSVQSFLIHWKDLQVCTRE